MSMKMDWKPPLPKSPIRLRSRRVLQSSNPTAPQSAMTTPGSLKKSANVSRLCSGPGSELRPNYLQSMSSEYQALTEMVRNEITNPSAAPSAMDLTSKSCSTERTTSLFERGRFYDQYSTRRNERLRKKQSCIVEETPLQTTKKSTAYDLGVTAGATTKRRAADSKKLESLKKSASSAAYSGEMTEVAMATPRYSLRSSTKGNKENSKPTQIAASSSAVKSRVVGSERKITTRRSRNI